MPRRSHSAATPLIAASLLMTPVAAAQTLVVANKTANTVSLFDSDSGDLRASVPVGDGPHEAEVSPDGRIAVIGNYGAAQEGSTLSVIDLTRAEVRRTIDLGKYTRPHGLDFLPDGDLLVTSETARRLLVVDVDSGEIERAIDTGQPGSHMVVASHDGRRAYTSNIGGGSVSVFDLERGERIAIIPTGAAAEAIDISPDGSELWVGSNREQKVSVVDTETLEVVDEIPCGIWPIRLKFHPGGGTAFATCVVSGDLIVFDADDRSVSKRIPLAETSLPAEEWRGLDPAELQAYMRENFNRGRTPRPIGVLAAPGGDRVFVAVNGLDYVAGFDTKTFEETARYPSKGGPDGLAWSPRAPR